MEIERVHLHHLRMDMVIPFETSFGRSETRDCILIEVFSEGLVGFGECVADRDPGYAYETVGTAWHVLRDFLVPLVIAKKLSHPSDLHQVSHGVRGHRMAKAGLEMALWDLYGKQAGQSLRELIGGTRDQVEVGVSVGIQKSPKELVAVVEGYLRQGYQRVKIKIKPGRDIDDTRTLRSAYPELRLMVDANAAYSIKTAAALHALEPLDLMMIEQPMAEDDLWDHSRLQSQLATPICLDESIRCERHARQALEMGACRVVNIKSGRVGGISEAMAIHQICLEQGVPVWCGGMLETGVGRAANLALASLPGFILPGDISATDRYYRTDITQQRFVLNANSTITVPEEPGLGVEIDWVTLQRATLAKLEIP